MRRIGLRDKVSSYLYAIVTLILIIYGLPRLPEIGVQRIGGLFTLVWLGLAALVLMSHLLVLSSPGRTTAQQAVTSAGRSTERRQRRMMQS